MRTLYKETVLLESFEMDYENSYKTEEWNSFSSSANDIDLIYYADELFQPDEAIMIG